ncbi:MAG: hypothetical protein IJM04_03680 [Prevotella sp.]|nr:hypothetical protein [Prevotella sp.]
MMKENPYLKLLHYMLPSEFEENFDLIDGMRVDKMTKGVNIVKYANGHTVKVVVK